jgi:hypothetical protein
MPLFGQFRKGNSANFALQEFSEVAPALVTVHTRLRCTTRGGTDEARPL